MNIVKASSGWLIDPGPAGMFLRQSETDYWVFLKDLLVTDEKYGQMTKEELEQEITLEVMRGNIRL